METREMGFKFKLSILLAIFLQFLINLNLFRIQESGFGENPDFAELKCGFFFLYLKRLPRKLHFCPGGVKTLTFDAKITLTSKMKANESIKEFF